MRNKSFTLFSLGLITTLLWGCGGGGNPGPKPLSFHFDDMYIARVAMEEKQPIIEAQNEYSKAKMERAEAEAGLEDVKTKMSVAKNERQQALLEEKSARAKEKAANDSGDMTRVNNAKRELRSSELLRRAADQKIEALKAKRVYLKRLVRYTIENMYAKEAKFELAKGRVAKKNNVRPRGFKISNYEKQASQRSREAQKSKALAEREKSQFEKEKKKWKSMNSESDKARGKSPK